jgi:hypothetical protein
MHRILREALPEAVGRSEFVVAIVADIRGFSSFSKQHESPDIAMYIRRVYIKLIDDYFSFSSFYKPTGDGLLVIVPYTEKTFGEIANRVVESCVRCVGEFASLCTGDLMINFPTPTRIGFGLTRGPACCLASEDKVLDYSGHLLDLASRLMNLARPSGIILDGAFGIDFLKPETEGLFERAEVYLRGLAESEPITVYTQKTQVQIPEDAKRPLASENWQSYETCKKRLEWEKLKPSWRPLGVELKRQPKAAVVTITCPARPREKSLKGLTKTSIFEKWEYFTIGAKTHFRINVDELCEALHSWHVAKSADVRLKIDYVPAA